MRAMDHAVAALAGGTSAQLITVTSALSPDLRRLNRIGNVYCAATVYFTKKLRAWQYA